ncbi:MAG TPA: hypothetical protein VFI35_08315 [Actinomycetota bacterium]|nr:hypothetical protein [Actinomycetota bacterium]
MSEADEVFAQEVARWRAISWRDLQKDLDDAVAYEIAGSDGVGYQFEVLVLWDDPRARTNLRVSSPATTAGAGACPVCGEPTSSGTR